jgi:hypothetical protein
VSDERIQTLALAAVVVLGGAVLAVQLLVEAVTRGW